MGQLCKLIPGHLVPKLAREHGIDKQARSFSAWSHVVSMLYAQFTHAIGLNDVCDGLREGEIALFDKAYVNFAHLFEPARRGVLRVTRARDNMAYRVRRKLLRKPAGRILRDELIMLTTPKSRRQYPELLRRVEMIVELDGKEVVMVFITNNFEWAASSVGDLYKSRWGIEVFFKQIKQVLRVSDFLGHGKQAIRWQLWSALLLYVLLRFQAWLGRWPHSFTRLFTLIRGLLWDRVELHGLLRFYGTAGGPWRMRTVPEALYLPGLEPPGSGTASG